MNLRSSGEMRITKDIHGEVNEFSGMKRGVESSGCRREISGKLILQNKKHNPDIENDIVEAILTRLSSWQWLLFTFLKYSQCRAMCDLRR
ncbi:hypothetical protein RRG08_015103 [Elysia crispata]|uniref:Uncharacterized protein n=1 Tax=Elysia crispata TaxID=231223 RepID=A0AAE1EB38_9GAST|nr:hypothetical protein RRG08_015103 [Elysia crispata]